MDSNSLVLEMIRPKPPEVKCLLKVTRSIEGKIHVSTIAQDSLFLHNDASSSKNEIMEEEERDT